MEIKKVISKLIVCLLMIIITFNLIQRPRVYADATDIADRVDVGKGVSEEGFNSMMDNGTVTVTPSGSEPEEKSIKDSMNFGKTTVKVLSLLVISIPVVAHAIMSLAVWDGHENFKLFTIGDTIAGNYDLFSVRFWDKSETGVNGSTHSIVDKIRDSVSSWYIGMRNLAAALMILIAIYIGIRMAISTVADEQARYKSMFINWIKGLLLLLSVHFIMVFIIIMSDTSLEIINSIGKTVDTGKEVEATVLETAFNSAIKTKSATALSKYNKDHPLYNAIVYLFLVIMYFKFFKLYFYRMLKVMFLVIISPIMCATYAIDKIGDNRSQAFDHFFTEFLTLVFKQPIHLLLYMVFIASADEIIKSANLLLIVFFFAMGSMEKMIERVIVRGKAALTRGLNDMKIKE